MIERIIELSIRNRFLVLIRSGRAHRGGHLCDAEHPGRCDTRPE